jgi:hypothetical protein
MDLISRQYANLCGPHTKSEQKEQYDVPLSKLSDHHIPIRKHTALQGKNDCIQC